MGKVISESWRENKADKVVYKWSNCQNRFGKTWLPEIRLSTDIIWSENLFLQTGMIRLFKEGAEWLPSFLLQTLDFKHKMKYNLWGTLREKGNT